jgi:hypothetical protein
VGLQAELPLRVLEAILDGPPRILHDIKPVHRLQQESLESEMRECLRWPVGLRIDQLQLVAFPDRQFAIRFRADADPVSQEFRKQRALTPLND